MVEHHVAIGTAHETIAKLIGVSLKTMKKHYATELERGLPHANAVVGHAVFEAARKGNVVAQIFWAKRSAIAPLVAKGKDRGYTARVESTGPDGKPVQVAVVNLVKELSGLSACASHADHARDLLGGAGVGEAGTAGGQKPPPVSGLRGRSPSRCSPTRPPCPRR